MNLSDQVISLELAKRLKELGVKQESIFYHVRAIDDWQITSVITEKDKIYWQHSVLDILPMEYYSAFTVAELGEMLPGMIKIEGDDLFLTMDCDRHPYYQSMNYIPMLSIDTNDEDSEADARAKTLIHLIENGLMKVSE